MCQLATAKEIAMNRRRILAAVLFAACSSIASGALASVKLCVKSMATFGDNEHSGIYEDYWPTDAERELRGAHVVIGKDNVQLFDGYLGDGLGTGDPGLGCTPTLNPATDNGTYFFVVDTLSIVTRAVPARLTFRCRH
jgi:hypothetical protein